MYLFLTMFLGGHFSIGYVWILPDGGYEFGIFWSVVVGLFTIVGGGAISLDNIITRWVDSSVSRKTNVYYRFLQLAVL